MPIFRYKKGDNVIWAIFFFLCIISIIEVFSASSTLTYNHDDFTGPVLKHSMFLLGGFVCMILISNVKCKYFKLMTPIALIISVITLLTVLLLGESTNGASRWLSIFGFQFQPSELAKGTMILAEAQILAAMQTPGGTDKRAFKYIVGLAFLICGLIFLENLSTAILLGIVVVLMMFVGGVSLKLIGELLGVFAILGGIGLFLIMTLGKTDEPKESAELTLTEKTVQTEKKDPSTIGKVFHRFDTWKKRIQKFGEERPKPEDFDLNEDAQVGHARIAIVNSNVFGVGPGNSVQRDFMPQAYSDFIFAIIIEELGLGGAFVICFLYTILLYRTVQIANKCENSFPAFLIMGLALMICIQAIFNMMVAVGLGPVTGQPLPLISRGGTSTILNCVYLGVILSVSHTAKKNAELANA
ncbi:MAG: FtsW/RodA/SpoVE family cell cycle protein [Bacteroidaceae bacterium]|nr:FtsW/RodA/SpoVE family cell cycle protein [Bacteroidaceae bacterium]